MPPRQCYNCAGKNGCGGSCMNTNLTDGKPWKVLLKYVLPLLGSAVFQQVYTLADTIIAGKFSGSETALTAIGASNAIVNILMAIALGANAGCAVLCARYFGAREPARVKSAVYTALVSFSVLSVLLLGVGLATSRPVLVAMDTPGAALAESVTYLNIYYLGVPFLILYNLGTGIFSALGDSRTPFIFLVFSSVANIVLDYFMAIPWGVAGVAWATFITQGVACLCTLVFVLVRVARMECAEKPPVFSARLLKLLLLLALPVALQNSFVSVGNLVIQIKINELANAQGIGITNGFAAGFKLLVFCTTCMCTCATGLTNYVSQNYGAHKLHRIRRGFYASLLISTAISALFVAVSELFAYPLVGLFMQEGESSEFAVRMGVQFVRTVAPFFFVVNVKINADGCVRGCNGNLGFMISTFSDLILRVVFVFVLASFLGFNGVGWAWNIGWTLGTVVALAFYFTIPVFRRRNVRRCAEILGGAE